MHHGFTLIELLVVVSLIGVLATLVLANLNAARERARDAQRKSDLRNIQTALRVYYNDNSAYPTTAEMNNLFGNSWADGSIVYMNLLPDDPLVGQSYSYTSSDSDTYLLEACLENKSDDKGIATTDITWCPSGWKYAVQP